MGRQRQRDAAEHSGPERIDLPRIELKSKIRNLPASLPMRHGGTPAAIDVLEESVKHGQSAGDVDEHLDDVRPDHGGRATAGRVDDHRRADDDHRPVTGIWVTTVMTSAVANSRTPSARVRVTRKIAAAMFFTPGPKRRCRSSYDVYSSPRK